MKIAIVDIDGTVADINHRLHFIEKYPRDYDGFYDACVDDTPITAVIDLVRALKMDNYYIIFVTGRPDTHRRETGLWLTENFIPYDQLLMRKGGDYRKDTVIKKEILAIIRAEYGEPEFALDDRASVVRMWRDNGVKCLQVAPGDFDKPKYRSGKLILMVGPSGAGKSTLLKTNVYNHSAILSSDGIRGEICEDFKDQTKNEQVFYAMHSVAKARLEAGLDAIIDATNIRAADRKAFLCIAPKDAKVEYHVVNRSLPEKLSTGGWRLSVVNKGMGLIERHEQIFQSNLKDILAGDNDPRVTVIDLRK